MEGVKAVESNHASGSVLIRYDQDALDAESLLEAGRQLGIVGAAAEPEVLSGRGANWRSQIDTDRLARSMLLLGAAVVGAQMGPAVGLSRRIGSIAAAFGAAVVARRVQGLRSRREAAGDLWDGI